MKKVLIIGFGNTLRGDDAAGIRAVEMIAEIHPEFNCICMHQPVPELSETISESDIVIFIDADANSKIITAKPLKPKSNSNSIHTHFLTPETLLYLSKKIYNHLPSKSYIIGIPASQFDLSEELSELTKNEISKSVKIVEELVKS